MPQEQKEPDRQKTTNIRRRLHTWEGVRTRGNKIVYLELNGINPQSMHGKLRPPPTIIHASKLGPATGKRKKTRAGSEQTQTHNTHTHTHETAPDLLPQHGRMHAQT